MAGAIELVHVPEVGPALVRLHQCEIGVQVAIGLLGAGDALDDAVHLSLELWVRMRGQGVRCGLNPLGHIRIVELMRPVGHAWLPVEIEHGKAPGLLASLVLHRQAHLAVGLLPLRQQATLNAYLAQGHTGSTRLTHGSPPRMVPVHGMGASAGASVASTGRVGNSAMRKLVAP